ncbi:MAG: STAS domain-containing protein [Planctomycetes bacterium]|nr:STAS domain-containing protein [Planctomycetota bacterium]
MGLTVEVAARTQGDVHVSTVVKLTGPLEPATLPVAEKAVRPLVAAGPKVLVFDLSGVDFVSSTGVGFLISMKAAMEKRGGACFISSPRPPVRRAIEIMRALPDAAVFGSVAELDAYLAEIQRKVEEGDDA